MELTTLKSKLETITDTDIQKVTFDFEEAMNQDLNKSYPLVFWAIDLSKFQKNLNTGQEKFTSDVFILGAFDHSSDNKFTRWDELIEDLETYLSKLSNLDDIFILTPEVDKELYPPGMLSVDDEIGVRYNVTLKLWC